MIPFNGNVREIKVISSPTNTYNLNTDTNRIRSSVDGLKAMEQYVFKVVNTERYKYLIYNWNYGIELQDLFGKPIPFVKAELIRRITEALITDDRVLSVGNFIFSDTSTKNTIAVAFTVETIYGNITSIREVNI
jgi:hypothetical protein